MPEHNNKAADIFADVGRALFSQVHDWQARLARALNRDRDTLRQFHRARSRFSANHPVFDDLLALTEQEADEVLKELERVQQRADEITKARDRLREWLEENRKS